MASQTSIPRRSGGRPQTAVERGYEPSCDGFTEGQTVRVDGMVGDRFTVLGFRGDTAELFTQAPGTGQRSITVERLRVAR